MNCKICLLKVPIEAKRSFRATLYWFLRQGQPYIKASLCSPQRDSIAPVVFGNVKKHRAFLPYIYIVLTLSQQISVKLSSILWSVNFLNMDLLQIFSRNCPFWQSLLGDKVTIFSRAFFFRKPFKYFVFSQFQSFS